MTNRPLSPAAPQAAASEPARTPPDDETPSPVPAAGYDAALLAEVCERATAGEPGRLALIAFACEGAAGPLCIAATAGDRTALPALQLGGAHDPSTGLLGAALLQRRPVVCHQSRADPAHARWAERAWRAGFRAGCAIPFVAGEGRTGVLGVFSPLDQSLGADEFDGLVEMVSALER